jgi:hypothetical protein
MQLLRDNLVRRLIPVGYSELLANTLAQTLWTSSEAETSGAGQADAPAKEETGAAAEPAASTEETKATE